MLAVRWVHGIAAVAWVGGGLFYLLVLRPLFSGGGQEVRDLSSRIGTQFRAVVDTAILVLILTGAVLAFDRLTSRYTDAVYVTILGLKAALSLWMFSLAYSRLRRRSSLLFTDPQPPAWSQMEGRHSLRRLRTALTGVNLLVLLGVIVFLLSDLLKVLFEQVLRR